MKYLDAHTHVHFAAFKDDYREAVARAREAGVGMITSGTQKDTSTRAVLVAHEFPETVWASVGLHPAHTDKSFHDEEELGGGEAARAFTSRGEVFDFDYYRKLAEDPKVVAVGECGLDYYRLKDGAEGEEQVKKQKAAFIKQIELSAAVGKPLVIHCRRAAADVIHILKSEVRRLKSNRPGIMHFFTDGVEFARQLVDMGFGFSVGGVITFARDYDEMIRMLPADRLLTETDAPYVTPVPYRGKRNEPAYVVEVVRKLAEIRATSAEKMEEQVLKNTKNFFCGIMNRE